MWFKQHIVTWMLPVPSSQNLCCDSSTTVTCSNGMNRMGLKAKTMWSVWVAHSLDLKKSSWELPLQHHEENSMTNLLKIQINLLKTKSLVYRCFFVMYQYEPEVDLIWSYSLQWTNKQTIVSLRLKQNPEEKWNFWRNKNLAMDRHISSISHYPLCLEWDQNLFSFLNDGKWSV